MSYQALNTTTGAGDTGQAGGNKINANFSELYAWKAGPAAFQTFKTCLIEQTHPTPGNTSTLATLTGAGVVREIELTVSYGNAWVDDRIQVFVDGEVLPSIDVDIGTLFGTAYDGTTTAIVQGTDNLTTSPAKNAAAVGFTFGTSKCWSGAMRFPIPYSNGCIIKVLAPTGMVTTGGFGKFFSQISYQTGTPPGDLSKYRLKSFGIPNISAVTYTATQQITWLDKPNNAGFVALLALAQVGATPTGGQLKYGYLERQEWIGVDGESTTPDGSGAINTSYASSGGEDWFNAGYYFAGQTAFTTPDVILTCANLASLTSCMSVDFLKRHGGVKFTSAVQMGWSRKDGASGNGFTTGHTGSYQILYYVDTSVTFVPSAPQTVAGTPGDTTGVVTWARPKSDGSSFLTGYTVSLSPGGASQNITADVNTATFTGLTNGTAYTPSVIATNAIGNSSAGTGSPFTPANASTVPGAPTGVTSTPGDTLSSIAFTAPASDGGSTITGYTATATAVNGGATSTSSNATSPISFTGLTNGQAYTFTVHATNANGNGPESTATAAGFIGGVIATDTFTHANGNLVGLTTTTGALTWAQSAGVFSPLIVSNKGTVNTSEAINTSQGASVDAGIATQTVTATFTCTTTAHNNGVIARFTTGTNNVAATWTASTLTLFVNSVSRGTFSAGVPGTSTPHTLVVDVRGTAVTVWLDGAVVITYTMTAPENAALLANGAGITFFRGNSPNETGGTQYSAFKVTN